jgi:ribonuclease HII
MLPTKIEGIDDDCICAYIDESGLGSLAGICSAAVVVWNNNYEPTTPEDENLLNMINDSKKLSEKKRELLAIFIKENAIDYAIHTIDNEEIDRINILQANYKAMHGALDKLSVKFDRIIVDGNRFKTYMNKDGDFIPHTCVIKGDGKILGIAAASIISKVFRDKYMVDLHNSDVKLQVYEFHKNKGYGSAKHFEALKENGLSEWHRKTFIHL